MKQSILTDETDKGDDIFNNFASAFASYKYALFATHKNNFHLEELQKLLEKIERKLQDLSENITAQNENVENIYSLTVKKSKEVLNFWLPIFSNFKEFRALSAFSIELMNLSDFLATYKKRTLDEIKTSFDRNFYATSSLTKESRDQIQRLQSKPEHEVLMFFDQVLSFISSKSLSEGTVITPFWNRNEYDGLVVSDPAVLYGSLKSQASFIPDSEEAVYASTLNLWIDTNNPAEANHFMYLIAGALNVIEGTKMEIIEAGTGSYWQNVKLKIKGWFQKEDVKRLVQKTVEAAESYALDRQIEPVKKSKAERKKIESETDRLMPIDQVRISQELDIELKREQLRSMQLDNSKKELALLDDLSKALASGLLMIKSDFRIQLNNLTLMGKADGKIYLGNLESFDDQFEKELPGLNHDSDSTD